MRRDVDAKEYVQHSKNSRISIFYRAGPRIIGADDSEPDDIFGLQTWEKLIDETA